MINWGENLSDQEIEEKVIKITADVLNVGKGKISRKSRFAGDLNADSLNTVYLVTEFEKEFGLSIPDGEVEKLLTVGLVVDYIKANAVLL